MILFSSPSSDGSAAGTAIALDARPKAREMSAENRIVVCSRRGIDDDLNAGELKLLLMSPSAWDSSHLIYFSSFKFYALVLRAFRLPSMSSQPQSRVLPIILSVLPIVTYMQCDIVSTLPFVCLI